MPRDPHPMVLRATPAEVAKYHLNFGWETAALHGESSRVLNVNGNPYGNPPQVGLPSNYQGFPNTAADLLHWLGDPAGWVAANVLAIYQCDTASPLVDSLGLGPNLVAAGAPLTGRECVGLGQAGSFTSKVGVEFPTEGGAERFSAAANGFGQIPAGTSRTFAVVWRCNRSVLANKYDIMGTGNGGPAIGWDLKYDATGLTLAAQTTTTAWADRVTIADTGFYNGWHVAFVVFDGTARTITIFTDIGDSAPTAYAGDINNAANVFRLGFSVSGSMCGQIAYVFGLDTLATSAMRAAFWRHGQLWSPYLHARTNPLIAPITAHRVAAWSGGNVGQPAIGYDANLVVPTLGNALGSGYVCEDGITFCGMSTADFYGGSAATAGMGRALADGSSGMRDGLRVTQKAGGGWNPIADQVFNIAPYVLAGDTRRPFRGDVCYRRATVGTSARMALGFWGDPGGSEVFTIVSDDATPVDWVRAGGTCTPTRAAHTSLYYIFGARFASDDCDYSELAVVDNRLTTPLAWRRTFGAIAAATTTPAISAANAGNYIYSPYRGRIKLTIGGFQGTNGATFLQFGAAAAAGSLTLDYSVGQLRLRIWDATPALAVTILCGPVTTARHEYEILWHADAPLPDLPWAYAAVVEGGAALGQWLTPWTAAPGVVTPLYFLSNAGANAARCFAELA